MQKASCATSNKRELTSSWGCAHAADMSANHESTWLGGCAPSTELGLSVCWMPLAGLLHLGLLLIFPPLACQVFDAFLFLDWIHCKAWRAVSKFFSLMFFFPPKHCERSCVFCFPPLIPFLSMMSHHDG